MTAAGTSPSDHFDQLVEVVPGQRAVVVRHVPFTLDVFTTHFPLFPVLPGVLLLDDLVQAARVVLHSVGDDGAVWRFGGLRRIRFRRYIGPGDVVEIGVQITDRTPGRAICTAVVRVDGVRVATVHELVLHTEELS